MARKSEHSHGQNERSTKRDRYWSVMLVGDHGRIIPFRRFKGIAISIVSALILAVLVIIGLGFAYMWQTKTINRLKTAIAESDDQISKLRDEKDLLLAKLVVNDKLPGKEKKKQPPAPVSEPQNVEKEEPSTPEPKPAKLPAAKAAKPVPAKEKTPPKALHQPVKLNADIRRFNVKYQSKRNLLQCEFRIYNTSKPKKPLAGRSIVVFKNLDDPPIKWLPVPRVELKDGVPKGQRGRSFKINNYRTMVFKAYGLKPPVRFNTASVYVYSGDGNLLLSREIPIQIDIPAPPPKKVAPKPAAKPPTASDSTVQPGQTVTQPAVPDSRKPSSPTAPQPEPVVPAPKPSTVSPVAPVPDSMQIPQTSTDTSSGSPPVDPMGGNATGSAPEQNQDPPGQLKIEGVQ